jgi:hypothetical protein
MNFPSSNNKQQLEKNPQKTTNTTEKKSVDVKMITAEMNDFQCKQPNVGYDNKNNKQLSNNDLLGKYANLNETNLSLDGNSKDNTNKSISKTRIFITQEIANQTGQRVIERKPISSANNHSNNNNQIKEIQDLISFDDENRKNDGIDNNNQDIISVDSILIETPKSDISDIFDGLYDRLMPTYPPVKVYTAYPDLSAIQSQLDNLMKLSKQFDTQQESKIVEANDDNNTANNAVDDIRKCDFNNDKCCYEQKSQLVDTQSSSKQNHYNYVHSQLSNADSQKGMLNDIDEDLREQQNNLGLIYSLLFPTGFAPIILDMGLKEELPQLNIW